MFLKVNAIGLVDCYSIYFAVSTNKEKGPKANFYLGLWTILPPRLLHMTRQSGEP